MGNQPLDVRIRVESAPFKPLMDLCRRAVSDGDYRRIFKRAVLYQGKSVFAKQISADSGLSVPQAKRRLGPPKDKIVKRKGEYEIEGKILTSGRSQIVHVGRLRSTRPGKRGVNVQGVRHKDYYLHPKYPQKGELRRIYRRVEGGEDEAVNVMKGGKVYNIGSSYRKAENRAVRTISNTITRGVFKRVRKAMERQGGLKK